MSLDVFLSLQGCSCRKSHRTKWVQNNPGVSGLTLSGSQRQNLAFYHLESIELFLFI